jgi:hypothetical protein
MTAEEARTASRKSGKAFCKVCFDAGKEYTSHYLRSAPGPDGKLVCPTLLNQSCLTCGQTGHTSSYCGKRKPMTKPHTTHTTHTTTMTTTTPMPPPAKGGYYNPKSNAFGALTTNDNATNDINNPQTMAERLKKSLALQQPQPSKLQTQQPSKLQTQQPSKLQTQQPPRLALPDLPPRPQFWWQDEDD